jgi:TonB family protein
LKTAFAYLTSLICHGIVLVPLAHLAVSHATCPPTYSVNRGSPAMALKATSAGPENDLDAQELQVAMDALPPLDLPAIEDAPSPPKQDSPDFQTAETETVPFITTVLPTRGDCPNFRVNENGTVPFEVANSEKTNIKKTPVEKPAETTSDKARQHLPKTSKLAGSGTFTGSKTSTGNSSSNAGGTGLVQGACGLDSNPDPPYPYTAWAHGIEGSVLLQVKIGADGSVEAASLHRSSGDSTLDDSALSTVRRSWRFHPATQDGMAIPYEALLRIRFKHHAD